MGKLIGNIIGGAIIYFSLVFRPRMLVRIAHDYYEGSKMLGESLKLAEELNHLLQTRSDR